MPQSQSLPANILTTILRIKTQTLAHTAEYGASRYGNTVEAGTAIRMKPVRQYG
jgi:hypothetical protein